MTISEVCQYELKEEVDKHKLKHPDLSLAECIRQIIQYYADVGIELKEETAKTKYKRAAKTIGSNEPTVITTQNHDQSEEKPVIVRNESGQFAEGTKIAGPGRKPKHSPPPPIPKKEPSIITDDFSQAFDLMLRAITNEKRTGWKNMKPEAVLEYLEILNNVTTIE